MSQQEKMRQTGRTTRIVQYVAEQLYNVGTCIATDHIVYEYTPTFKMMQHFKEKVEREIEVKSNGSNSVKSTQITVDGIPYIKFELKTNKMTNE
jgi:hypothetical protein